MLGPPPPAKRKTSDGRTISVQRHEPQSQAKRAKASNRVQPKPQDPQQVIGALSDALMACRDENLVESDHFKIAQRLVPSMRHALENVRPKDRDQLMQPLLRWHVERQGTPP
jgi:hypothetical protein